MVFYNCNPCNSFCSSSGDIQQHLFLGLSVQEFSADAGWGDQVSEISVVLAEDPCDAPSTSPKICYDVNLDRQESYDPDPGFVAENRYLSAATGQEYSATVPIDGGDTLLRSAVNILGSPAYFRFQDFEFGGIIGDWVKTTGTDGISYRVKLTDPRIILEGCQLILGSFSDRVDKDIYCSSITPYNLFNVFGYMEEAGGGALCPSVTQYPQFTYQVGGACDFPIENDGAVIGAPMGYFGGAYRNDRGMPLFKIIEGVNALLNQVVVDSDILPFSPLGRIVYPCADTGTLGVYPCGLVLPDASLVTGHVSGYFLDLYELPNFGNSIYYRIEDDIVSVLDLIARVCQEAGFDYYFELMFVKSETFTNGIGKFIKLRTVNRKVPPSLNNIANALNNVDCVENSSFGLEMRNEETSSFVIGGNKKTIYQAIQSDDPDGNGDGIIGGLTTLFVVFGGYVLSNTANVNFNNSLADDMIAPYFGQFKNKNVKLPYYIDPEDDGDTEWAFLIETSEIISAMNVLNLSTSQFVEITELDLRFALMSFDSWLSWIFLQDAKTTPYPRIFDLLLQNNPDDMANIDGLKDVSNLIKNRPGGAANGEIGVARDMANPKKKQFVPLNALAIAGLVYEDLRTIYNLVLKYGREYYGVKYMVRVPYTCVFPDVESIILDPSSTIGYIANKTVVSERPSNSGGWTEYNNVLGLPLYSYGIRFFTNEEGLIEPFIRHEEYNTDLSNFNVDDFIVYWQVAPEEATFTKNFTGEVGEVTGEAGRGLSGETSNIIFDETNGNLFYKNAADEYVQVDLSASTLEEDLTDDPPVDSFVRTSSNPNTFRIWNGSSWIEIVFEIFIRIQLEEEYVFVDYQTSFSPRIVFSLPQALHQRRSEAQHIEGFNTMSRALAKILGKPIGELVPANEILGNVGGKEALIGIFPVAQIPRYVAIPLESQILRYGPWFNFGTPGKIKVIKDDSLVPWNFGSYDTMKIAGDIIASETVTSMRFGEIGSVTISGSPCLGLGAELGANQSTYYQAGSHLLEGRSHTVGVSNGINYGYVEAIAWDGAYGPNITSINISFGASGISTTYQMRTFANRRGVLNKYFLERISHARQLTLQVNKRINQEVSRILRNKSQRFQAFADKRYLFPNNRIIGPGSEHEVFLGQDVPFSLISEGEHSGEFEFVRPILSTGRLDEVAYHLQENFQNKSIMSLDGLLRNVSMDGDGGITPFVRYPGLGGIIEIGNDRYLYPDCSLTGEGILIPYARITQDYLNPFSNPVGFQRSEVVEYGSDTPNTGHDIEILARSNDNGPEGMVLPITGYSGEYKGDYYDDYRGMALRGPILLKSWCYDTYGYPVPNKVDTFENASQGTFVDDLDALEPKFMDDWLRQSDCWPVAPIDLRLDRERGIFTIPTNLTGRNVVLVSPCSGDSTGDCYSTSGEFYDFDGIYLNGFAAELLFPIIDANYKYVTVYNPLHIPLLSTQQIIFCLVVDNKYVAFGSNIRPDKLPFDQYLDFDQDKNQVLTHHLGCLKWIDLEGCPEPAVQPNPIQVVKNINQQASGETYIYDDELTVPVYTDTLYKFNLFIIYSGGLKHKFEVPNYASGDMVMTSNNENYLALDLEEEKIEDTYSGEAVLTYTGVFRTSSDDFGPTSVSFMFGRVSGEPDPIVYRNSYFEVEKIS